MNRFDRITSILLQLQSKRVVTAQEIAKKHGISVRTVYRDIRSLEEGGIPIVSDAGVGYSIVEGYHLPPVRFTKEEAISFLTAEKLMEKMTDRMSFEVFESAVTKIKAVLKSDEKAHLENMGEHIEIRDNPYFAKRKRPQNFLQDILRSIHLKEVIAINYFSNHDQKSKQREVEPVGVYLMENNWYLIAYCWLRKDYRTFRLDRIEQLKFSSKPFTKKHLPLKSFMKELSTKAPELHAVVMTVDKEVLKFLGEQKYYHGFISQKDLGSKVEMSFLCPSLEGFARWYIMFGDHADIVQPKALKMRVQAMVQALQKKLK